MVCLWYNVIQVVKKQFERNAGEKNMKKILDLITGEVTQAFVDCGYDAKYGKVTLSNRPDLCEYQCNGAMAAAKEYKKAPFMIADEVAEKLSGNAMFSMVESVKPGFLNLKLDEAYLADYVAKMQADEGRYGCEKTKEPKTIMIDYGGPNVAKPLHVGHLRSAIIGESIKRIGRFMGHTVIGDVHLGDWGLQMGLIITELRERKPDLVYFDVYRRISRGSAVYHLRAGGDLPDSQRQVQGGRRLQGGGDAGNLRTAARQKRVSGTAFPHLKRFRYGLKAQL